MIHLSGLGAPEKLIFIKRGSGWRIEAGISKFLVAEGPGWTMPLGAELLKHLRQTRRSKRSKRK